LLLIQSLNIDLQIRIDNANAVSLRLESVDKKSKLFLVAMCVSASPDYQDLSIRESGVVLPHMLF
jgi:hypothetical protein